MSSRRRKEVRGGPIHEAARHMRFVEDAMASLKPAFEALNPPIVRTFHIGPFSGEPESFAVTFIFARRRDAKNAIENETANTAANLLIEGLRQNEYPPEALKTFTFYTASEDETQDSGGDFAYFR